MTMGQQIRYARERAGMTRAQLASELGIGPARLANIEQGKAEPRRYVVIAAAYLTGNAVTDFIPDFYDELERAKGQ